MARSVTAHGLIVWFDATLATDITYSNAPGAPRLVYGNTFFPWQMPVALEPGDILSITLKASLVGQNYVWYWSTQVQSSDSLQPVKAQFQQSTFWGKALTREQVIKRSETYIPSLQEPAKMDIFALNQMEEGLPLGKIAQRLMDMFPQAFPTYQEAFSHVVNLSQRYG